MIKELTIYTVICDNCGKDVSFGQEFAGWNDKDYAFDIAVDAYWHICEDNQYCPDCFEYDDDDNLIIKQIKP